MQSRRKTRRSSSPLEWFSHAQPFLMCTFCTTRMPAPMGGACVKTSTAYGWRECVSKKSVVRAVIPFVLFKP